PRRLHSFQDAACGQSGGDCTGSTDGDARTGFAGFRGFHAVPPARHQTHVCLFVHRAHGHHYVCFRHVRTARQFRGSSSHDHAFAHQIGNLFCSRSCRAGQAHPTHRRHGRSHESHPVLGWTLILGVVAIAGLPPLGIFTSEFLVVSSTFAR